MPIRVKHLNSWVGSGPYPQTLDYGGKGLPGPNTQAYYEHLLITAVKMFYNKGGHRGV
jgi:hypothetical protein